MNNRIPTSRKGFTLVELLTVIAIIGILAGILFPTIGKVVEKAKQSTASNNARTLAQSYSSFAAGGTGIVTQSMHAGGTRANGVASSIEDVAFILAQKASMNEGGMWFITSDDALNGAQIPQSVILGDPMTVTDVAPDFRALSPKSWAFVVGVSPAAPASKTPLLWTYGLGHDGKWVMASPWKNTGGHIAFLDGHVIWATLISLDPGPGETSLTSYSSNTDAGQLTTDYAKAINSQGTKPWIVVNTDGKGT
jgi:prepilin-type N-terminal cleavage/methylation domain-containing protein/prepilin-type processing-associated H-X9-DG protein